MAKNVKDDVTEISIVSLKRASVKLRIIGVTPLIQNRMAAKAQQQLLVGGGKKTAAEKAHVKHHPLQEFRDACELSTDGPTALLLKTTAIKGAMTTAALETAGVTKTSAQRLLYLPGDFVPLYGTPQLRMSTVRMADMKHTPDIRSRPCFPHWGAEVDISFITPPLFMSSVVNLLFNAGLIIGVGDGRQEKGRMNCGLFRVIGEGETDAEWNDLVKNHGRKAQEIALANPEFYDKDTADLMAFWERDQVRRRTTETTVAVKKPVAPRKPKNGQHKEIRA
jgi:hypothetical protein